MYRIFIPYDLGEETQRDLLLSLKNHSEAGPIKRKGTQFALSLGAVFSANVSRPPLSPQDYIVPQVSQSFARSLQQAPAVAQAMWGQPFAETDNLDTGKYYHASDFLQPGLTKIMGDIPTFLAFHDNRTFETDIASLKIYNVSTIGKQLQGAAAMYLVSAILQQNDWYAVPVSGDYANSYYHKPNCLPLNYPNYTLEDSACSDSDGATTVHSIVTQQTYSLSYNGKGKPPISPSDLVTQLAQNGTVIWSALLDGAYGCTFQGTAGQPIQVIKPDNSIDLSCLSTLPIYLTKVSQCPAGAVFVGGKCPFGYES